MDHEMAINMRLGGIENANIATRDKNKEDRLDAREQRKNQGESLKKFESSGNDVVGGGMGLSSFDPR